MNEDIFNILNEIIDRKFILFNAGGYLKIEEKKSPRCQSVKIQTTNKVFALSLDNNSHVFSCFNKGVRNINKKNDAIIFFKKNDFFIVLLIELKSNNSGEYLGQLKAGKNFVEYLFKQIDLFYKIKIDNSKIIYRGILFSTKRSPAKGTTKKMGLTFEDRNGLICTTANCNEEYKLQKIKESISLPI